jgi:predicted amidohydrolase
MPTRLADPVKYFLCLRIPSAYCNHTGERERFLGGSCLIGTDGKAVVVAAAEDTVIVGEISLAASRSTSRMFPYRADRRPELYGRLTSSDVQR